MAGGAAAGAAAGAAIGAAVGATIGENVEEPARRERRWSVWRLFTLCIESLGLEANSPDPLHERGFHLYSQTGRLSRE